MIQKVAVVGAGIIGLSTALEIQKLCPNVQVTILAEKMTPNTTADGAAGIFGLYLLGNQDPDDQVRWAQKTHDLFEKWWKSPSGGKMGVSLISCARLNHSQIPPIWKDIVFGLREMSKEELSAINRLTGKHESGLEMLTFTAEPVRFMPYLMKEFQAKGGIIKRTRVTDLNNLLTEYDCVVNSTGAEARSLTGDLEIKPLRGQVMRVHAPWIRTVVLDDLDDGNYVIANQESVVVGGTHQLDDWDFTPRKQDTSFIRSGGQCLEPTLSRAKETNHWVGMRPGRNSVRLERDGRIVHNYGHGGSGITIFQGCAEDAAQLVLNVLTENGVENLRSKL